MTYAEATLATGPSPRAAVCALEVTELAHPAERRRSRVESVPVLVGPIRVTVPFDARYQVIENTGSMDDRPTAPHP